MEKRRSTRLLVATAVFCLLCVLAYSHGSRMPAGGAAEWYSVVPPLLAISLAFATGRIAKYFGLSFTLASVPVMIGAGMLLVAAAPMVAVVVALQIVRRAGNYAISRPAREMLFTAVDREVRFKAKPVIDIVIYRGGDMLNAWAFTALTQGLGLGMASVALFGSGIAALWALTGIYLGRRFMEMTPDHPKTVATS